MIPLVSLLLAGALWSSAGAETSPASHQSPNAPTKDAAQLFGWPAAPQAPAIDKVTTLELRQKKWKLWCDHATAPNRKVVLAQGRMGRTAFILSTNAMPGGLITVHVPDRMVIVTGNEFGRTVNIQKVSDGGTTWTLVSHATADELSGITLSLVGEECRVIASTHKLTVCRITNQRHLELEPMITIEY